MEDFMGLFIVLITAFPVHCAVVFTLGMLLGAFLEWLGTRTLRSSSGNKRDNQVN